MAAATQLQQQHTTKQAKGRVKLGPGAIWCSRLSDFRKLCRWLQLRTCSSTRPRRPRAGPSWGRAPSGAYAFLIPAICAGGCSCAPAAAHDQGGQGQGQAGRGGLCPGAAGHPQDAGRELRPRRARARPHGATQAVPQLHACCRWCAWQWAVCCFSIGPGRPCPGPCTCALQPQPHVSLIVGRPAARAGGLPGFEHALALHVLPCADMTAGCTAGAPQLHL